MIKLNGVIRKSGHLEVNPFTEWKPVQITKKLTRAARVIDGHSSCEGILDILKSVLIRIGCTVENRVSIVHARLKFELELLLQ